MPLSEHTNVVVHIDRGDATEDQRVTVYDLEVGAVIWRGRKIRLHGTWVVRMYNNPVPCGATIAMYPDREASGQWEPVLQ